MALQFQKTRHHNSRKSNDHKNFGIVCVCRILFLISKSLWCRESSSGKSKTKNSLRTIRKLASSVNVNTVELQFLATNSITD